MNIIAVIGCIVGIVSCLIGVATFTSAQMSRSKQDGMLIAKIDQCVQGITDIKKDIKEKNHEVDRILDDHTKAITKLETEMITVFKQLKMER